MNFVATKRQGLMAPGSLLRGPSGCRCFLERKARRRSWEHLPGFYKKDLLDGWRPEWGIARPAWGRVIKLTRAHPL